MLPSINQDVLQRISEFPMPKITPEAIESVDRRPLPRRDLLRAGGAVAGVAVLGGCQTATGINPLVPPAAKVVQDRSQTEPTAVAGGSMPPAQALDSKEKPTYVAQARDPVAYSIADNLFWNDILMEHALFFTQLMPGRELEEPRRQAEEFNRLFAQQFEQSRTLDAGNYVAFNQRSIDNARRFSDWKKEMKGRQESGKLQSLVWPLFFEHTAREADRFSQRLALYSRRQIEFDRAEVVDFWSKTMSEHSAFIAHLLDPQEKLLIEQAERLEKAFANPSALRGGGQADPVMKAAEEILDYKTVGEKGIRSGMIKSIIRPELAAHVRREAVRFVDELKRTRPMTT
jgi:hypothetical protein